MNDRFLKTGVFLAPFHPLDENPLLALDRDMELLVHLDRLNYHEAWIGEHHSGGFEIIACPELFIAGAAERTRHIRLGTGVVSVPYHNPFTLAGRMMQLDYMTRGRAMFGVGPGSLVYDAVKMGLNPQDQRRKLNAKSERVPFLRQNAKKDLRSSSQVLSSLLIRETGVLGFEPRQTDPESVVLPLHYTPFFLILSLTGVTCKYRTIGLGTPRRLLQPHGITRSRATPILAAGRWFPAAEWSSSCPCPFRWQGSC